MMASNDAASEEVAPESRQKLMLVVTTRDIVFICPSCQGQLVVDRDGAGLEVPCSHCGQTLTIPLHQSAVTTEPSPGVPSADRGVEPPGETPARAFDFDAFSSEQLQRRFDDLKHQLKENRSQDTELRGHVNRATMELHRLQLRLKKLQERHADIDAELTALQSRMEPGAA